MEQWDDLRYFLAVARVGGLSAAARELGVEASTVHRRIGQLEDRLSTRLFNRLPRGVQLTAAGRDLMESTERVEAEIFASERRVLGHDASLSGVVRIAAAEDVASYLLTDVLLDLRTKHPAINLEIVIGNARLSLSRGEADIAVRIGGGQTHDPDVVARNIGELRGGLYASEAYLERHGRPRRSRDLPGHALVAGHGALQSISAPLEALLSEPHSVYRADSVSHMAVATAAGFGIALLPCFISPHFPGLTRLFPKLPLAMAPLWVLVHHEVRRAPRVQRTVQHLKDALQARQLQLEGRG